MRILPATLAASLVLVLPAAAQVAPPPAGSQAVAQPAAPAPAPGEIVAAAPAGDWVAIAPRDLLVMTLAPPARRPGQASRDGNTRQVTIQLMPPPFSQGWVGNIRKLAAAKWWDGLAITRVQDNYVVQWGDPEGEDKAKAKALPGGLQIMTASDYTTSAPREFAASGVPLTYQGNPGAPSPTLFGGQTVFRGLQSSEYAAFAKGFPYAGSMSPHHSAVWPIHCYGMVGVGRNLSPDTGSGAELYTVIGHAPRHLDRNIALVGRVVEGIEHLSSLPRGTGALGFYEEAEQRVPIISIRLASELPEADPASSSQAAGQQTRPKFEYLSTESDSFARYADARANRRDPFFNLPAGGADICNVPVPVRRVADR